MADTKISALTAGTALAGTEEIPGVQSAATVKFTPTQIRNYVLATPVAVVGNATAGAEIRLPEDTDNGTNYVAIKAPDNLGATYTLTLPPDDGNNGQVLTTDGAGVLSWGAGGGGGSPGGSSGDIQFNDAGAFNGSLLKQASNIIEQRAGSSAQTFRVYNTFTDATNYERGFARWNTNVFEIGTENLGTGSARDIRIAFAANLLFKDANNSNTLTLDGGFNSNQVYGFQYGASGIFGIGPYGGVTMSGFAAPVGWTSTLNSSPDIQLRRNVGGILAVRGSSDSTGGALNFLEQTAPAAPSTDQVVIYAEDNGSGKTRLMARFATGAAQQIAIEP